MFIYKDKILSWFEFVDRNSYKNFLTLPEDCELSEYFSDYHSSVAAPAVLCIAILQWKPAILSGKSFFFTVENLSSHKVADYLKKDIYYLYLLGHFLQNVLM